MRPVAVFEIHMLKPAEATMKPSTSRRPLVPPITRTMPSARRRWAPLLCIALLSMKPVRNRMTRWWP